MEKIDNELEGKSVLILGYGREGKSTLKYILDNKIKCTKIGIADINAIDNTDVPSTVLMHCGENYMEAINQYDIVFQSPGVSLKNVDVKNLSCKIVSQTYYILKYYGEKIIGITGTKGKSTTSTMVYDMLKQQYVTEFVGNIGIPAFSMIEKLEKAQYIVYELSSHQLEYVHNSPHVAVILNVFEEHLDHYINYQAYVEAKKNIARYQQKSDIYIYGAQNKNELVSNLDMIQNVCEVFMNSAITQVNDMLRNNDVNLSNICGEHNMYNLLVAIKVANYLDVDIDNIIKGIEEFRPLPHRLEFVADIAGVKYYDDSISTIPEATIQAINSILNVSVVLIGGMDRGIDYTKLEEYILKNKNITYILMYESGKRIYMQIPHVSNVCLVANIEQAVNKAKEIAKKGESVVLSPAAASYGYFKNFEERGEIYAKLVRG